MIKFYVLLKILIPKWRHHLLLAAYSGLLSILCYTTAIADQNHYNNLLIGDRAAGLGGAYTAIADDPSGLYYNPAGIVHALGSNISGSMNALHMTTTTYKNALGNNTNWKRESSTLLPSFFGVFQPLGAGKIGFSYAVLDSMQEDQDQTFTNIAGAKKTIDSYTINFNIQDIVYNFGPSYAFEYSERLSFGITLYGHSRKKEQIIHELIAINAADGGDFEQGSQYLSIEETGVRPILGVMWSPRDKFSLGASLSRTYILSSDINKQETFKAQGQSSIALAQVPSDEKRQLPLTFTLGAAYFYDASLLLSTDITFYDKTNDNVTGYRERVFNIALGAEYYIDSELALRAGFYTNNANTPTLKSTGANTSQPEHVDLAGMSFSTSHFTRNSVLTLGAIYSWGDGEAQLFAPDTSDGSYNIQEVKMNSLTLFLSGTYSY